MDLPASKIITYRDVKIKMILACCSITEQAIGWKEIAATDGVHLVETRYEKMATIFKTVLLNCSKEARFLPPVLFQRS